MTMFVANVFGLGKATLAGDETEKRLSTLLLDDTVQVISSFELNQIASLTYHEVSRANGALLSDKIFEVLEEVLSKPALYSALTLQKGLVTLKHIVIYGAEKVLSSANTLGRYAENLQNYNTILIAQQQSSATSMFYKLKGGGVDKGGPVRQEAEQVYRLLSNKQYLYYERNTKADPNSLVPIGNNHDVAFVADDVRLYALKKRMEEQKRMMTKSNLAKADNGFGSGYTSRDGKSVVGAAHGLDEMIQMAEREKKKFTDDGPSLARPEFADYQAPSNVVTSYYNAPMSQPAEVDLLDFQADCTLSVGTAASDATTQDLMGPGFDLYNSPPASNHTADLLSLLTVNEPMPDPYKTAQPYPQAKSVDPYAGLDPYHATSSTIIDPVRAAMVSGMPKPATDPIPSNHDRFTAFDDLNVMPVTLHSARSNDASQQSISRPHPSAFQSHITPAMSNIRITSESQVPAWSLHHDDSDHGFVMGGTEGAGLQPLGAAPMAPPPPPPPAGHFAW